jgi:glutamate synthase (ferredoxin)
MNKIGISTLHLQSSSDFEILGLNKTFLLNISQHSSRIEGIGLTEIEKEIKKRYQKLFQILK